MSKALEKSRAKMADEQKLGDKSFERECGRKTQFLPIPLAFSAPLG